MRKGNSSKPFLKSSGTIIFIGPVAAGKTTLIRELHSYLIGKGVKAITIFIKTHLGILARALAKLFPQNFYQLYREMFSLLVALDISLLTFKVLVASLLSRFMVVLVEEHLIGTINDYMYISKIYLNKDVRCIEKFYRIIYTYLAMSKPSFIIYIHIDKDKSYERQKSRGDLGLEDEKYLTFQSRFLKLYAESIALTLGSKFVTINSKDNPKKTLEEILRAIEIRDKE